MLSSIFTNLTQFYPQHQCITYSDLIIPDLTSTYFEADPPFPEGDSDRPRKRSAQCRLHSASCRTSNRQSYGSSWRPFPEKRRGINQDRPGPIRESSV